MDASMHYTHTHTLPKNIYAGKEHLIENIVQKASKFVVLMHNSFVPI